METITLIPKVYGQYRNRLLNEIQSEIEAMIGELDLTSMTLDVDKKDHVFVSAKGPDAEFVINLLAQEYGKSPEVHEVLPESTHAGQLVDVGKVGWNV